MIYFNYNLPLCLPPASNNLYPNITAGPINNPSISAMTNTTRHTFRHVVVFDDTVDSHNSVLS